MMELCVMFTYQEAATASNGALDDGGAGRAVDTSIELWLTVVIALTSGDVELVSSPANALAARVVRYVLRHHVVGWRFRKSGLGNDRAES